MIESMGAPLRQRASSPTHWDRFVALDEDDGRELIDGQLVRTEMPTQLHEHIVLRIAAAFLEWVDDHGGAAYASGYPVRVDARRGFMPDRPAVSPQQSRPADEGGLPAGRSRHR